MVENNDNIEQNLNFNALLMLSFFEKGINISPEDKEQFNSMVSFEDASTASVYLLKMMMNLYAAETGRTVPELAEFLRGILLEMSSSEG
jgi:hypothetical protein